MSLKQDPFERSDKRVSLGSDLTIIVLLSLSFFLSLLIALFDQKIKYRNESRLGPFTFLSPIQEPLILVSVFLTSFDSMIRVLHSHEESRSLAFACSHGHFGNEHD